MKIMGMQSWDFVIGVLLLIVSIFIIVVVVLQESKQSGLGAVTGEASESFFAKGGNRTKEAKLKKLTKIAAFLFVLLALAANIIYRFVEI